jgi:DNA polymerase-1
MVTTTPPRLIRDWQKWLEHVAPYPDDLYALDLETTGLSPWNNRLAVVGLYHENTHAAGILHFPNRSVPKLNHLPKELMDWIQNPRRNFVVFNGVGFDWYFLHEAGVNIFQPNWHDSMISEGCVIKASRRDVRVSLAASYKRELGKDLKKEINHETWLLPELSDDQLAYVAADIMYLPKLMRAQSIKAADDTRKNAIAVEQMLTKVVARMTINGFPVRVLEPENPHTFENGAVEQTFQSYIQDCAEWSKEVAEELKTQFNRPDLNVGSWQQIQWMFLNLGLGYKTKTDEAAMVRLRDNNSNPEIAALAEKILFVKVGMQRAKMYKPQWFNDFVHEVRPGVWVIRPRYWQIGTETGRFSCSDPNLQQIASDCRTFFGQEAGKVCLSADYSQLEVRIQAWLCQDEALLEACDAEDMHSSVAATIWQIPIERVTKEQRKLAKAGTFTFLFGGGAQLLYEEALTQGSPMTLKAAQDFESQFFGRFQGLARAKARAIQTANTHRQVQLVMPHGLIRQVIGENMRPTVLMNTKVQGGAASGLKFGLIMMERAGLGPYMAGTFHDENMLMASPELMGDWIEPDLTQPIEGQLAAVTKYCMEQGMLEAFPGEINGKPFPVKVEGSIGPWWKGRPPYTKEEILAKAHGSRG